MFKECKFKVGDLVTSKTDNVISFNYIGIISKIRYVHISGYYMVYIKLLKSYNLSRVYSVFTTTEDCVIKL